MTPNTSRVVRQGTVALNNGMPAPTKAFGNGFIILNKLSVKFLRSFLQWLLLEI